MEQRMCLGTFSRLRRSLATTTLSAAVRILAERFLLYRKAISCKVKKDCKSFNLQPHHIYLQNRIQETLHLLTYLRLGYALDRLVSVSYMCYHTSTSDLSTSSSSRGLTTYVGISHLEGGFTLRCLQRLSLPGLATLPWPW